MNVQSRKCRIGDVKRAYLHIAYKKINFRHLHLLSNIGKNMLDIKWMIGSKL